MKESEIERKMVRYCRELGILTYKFTSPSSRGVPDRILMHGGRVLFVELKQEGNKPTPLQQHEMARIRDAGVQVAWVDSWDKARELVTGFYSNGETPP